MFLACMAGAAFFCALSGHESFREKGLFLFIMAVGIVASMVLGAAIGAGSANQMAATSVTVPVMMIFSFLPMLSVFNKTIKKIAEITYSQQISQLFNGLGKGEDYAGSAMIIAANMIVFGVLFGLLYKKGGLCRR